MSEAELRKAMNFSESDLDANRAGKLTPKQDKAIGKSEQIDSYISIGLAILMLGLAIAFTFRPITQMAAQGVTDSKGLLIVVAVWLFLGGFAAVYFVKAFNKLNRGVRKATGKVSFAKVERRVEEVKDGRVNFVRNEVQYDLNVGMARFNGVDAKLMKIMDEGDIYTVYYVNGFGILSAEPA